MEISAINTPKPKCGPQNWNF